MNHIFYFLFFFVFGMLGSFVTLSLSWFSLTSPGAGSRRAILTIKSSDGATLWLGLFRSCASTKFERFTCTPFTFNPTYNFSVLGVGAPTAVIETAAPVLRGLAWMTTILTIFLVPMVVWFVMRLECTALKPQADSELFVLLCLLALETITCLVGALNFWFMELFYEKTGQHFNVITNLLNRPDLTASKGTSFHLAYVAYGLVGVVWLLTAFDITLPRKPAPPPPPTVKGPLPPTVKGPLPPTATGPPPPTVKGPLPPTATGPPPPTVKGPLPPTATGPPPPITMGPSPAKPPANERPVLPPS